MILESPKGIPGKSSMGNKIMLRGAIDGEEKGINGALAPACSMKVVGWCTFASVKVYKNQMDFEADEESHLVARDSGYGWKKGHTKTVYGWVVGEYSRFESDNDKGEDDDDSAREASFRTAIRRKRSIYELEVASTETQTSMTASTSTNRSNAKKRKKHKNQKPGQKKRRY